MALTVPIPDEKRAAIAAALLSGSPESSVRAVSRQFGVSVSTVSKIKSELKFGVFEQARTEIKEREQHDQKIEKLVGLEQIIGAYLSKAFEGMAAQVEITSRPEYLQLQKADAVAQLHEAIGNHALRILEAAAAAQKVEAPEQ